MKKSICLLAAGIMLSMVVATGCTQAQGQTTETVADSSAAMESMETAGPDEEVEAEEPGTGTVVAEEPAVETEEPEAEGREERTAPVRIWGVVTETGEHVITVDNQSGVSSPGEIELMIDPDFTYVLDGANGLPVAMEEIQTGSFQAYLGPAMTMSLPPQTTPYAVIVNIPEDAAAPLYLIAAGAVAESDGMQVLTASDGTEYRIAEDARIQPFLTKNIVRMEDIREGSECLLWLDADGAASRIVLLAQ
ncbi:MAG: hypothetical protein LUE65_07915 [Clostridiales bacterium]|nr:hypothetical protein [Clostridiales bacterium]